MNGIHSTVPEKNQQPMKKADVLKGRILRSLKQYHRGKENAVDAGALADGLRFKSTGTHQGIRKLCKVLLVEDGEPIASCSKGFFYAIYQHEMTDFINNLVKRKRGIERDLGASIVVRDKLEKVENMEMEFLI